MRVASLPEADLLKNLSSAQQDAYLNDIKLGRNTSRWIGIAVHNGAFKRLENLFPERFEYKSSWGPDFLDTISGRYVELTTPKSLAGHQAKYITQYADNIDYITYDPPKF